MDKERMIDLIWFFVAISVFSTVIFFASDSIANLIAAITKGGKL